MIADLLPAPTTLLTNSLGSWQLRGGRTRKDCGHLVTRQACLQSVTERVLVEQMAHSSRFLEERQ